MLKTGTLRELAEVGEEGFDGGKVRMVEFAATGKENEDGTPFAAGEFVGQELLPISADKGFC